MVYAFLKILKEIIKKLPEEVIIKIYSLYLKYKILLIQRLKYQQKQYNNKFKDERILIVTSPSGDEGWISLISAGDVYQILKKRGINVSILVVDRINYKTRKLILRKKPTLVFIIWHGTSGEDGEIQRILEKAQISYVGSNSETSRNCFNKNLTKG
ncbi:hypothetical protein ACFLRM_06210, partial [Acidobacteriota bacterium]